MQKTNLLNRHLKATGENYFEHFLFAFVNGMWLFALGLVLICHAFFPFLFQTTASESVEKVNEVMQKRAQKLKDNLKSGNN